MEIYLTVKDAVCDLPEKWFIHNLKLMTGRFLRKLYLVVEMKTAETRIEEMNAVY